MSDQYRFHIFSYDQADRIQGQYSTDQWPAILKRLGILKATRPGLTFRVKDIHLDPLGKHQRI